MGDLVKTGLGKNTQDAKYYDTPQQAMGVANQNLSNANYGDPSLSFGRKDVSVDPASGMPGYAINENGDAPPPNITGGNLKPNFLSASPQLPQIQKPSAMEASVTGKGLTKKGLLLSILTGAVGGAAAGAGTYGGEGFQRGAAFTNNRKLQFLDQQRQADQDKERAIQEARQQQLADQQGQLYNSEIAKNVALSAESQARATNKDLNPQQIVELKKAEAQSAGFKEGSPEYNEYVYAIKPTKDSTPNAYGDFREGYPKTPEGRQQAARDWNAQIHKGAGNKAASHADQIAEAEDIAGAFLDHAKGDPNKAMADFTKAQALVHDKRQLALAPHIRNAIRGSRRVQNVDPLAGLLNNNSPQ